MEYDVRWIQKNLGISRKTLLVYENPKWGFLKERSELEKGLYRKYTYDDIVRIWYIKFLVKLGYSLQEIKDMSMTDGDDIQTTIGQKILELEREKQRIEQLIGHAKMIKLTGIMPSPPKELGSITFDDFLEYSYQNWNVDQTPQTTAMYQFVDSLVGRADEIPSENDLDILVTAIESFPEAELKQISTVFQLLLKYKHLGPSDPVIQHLVKKLYEVYIGLLSVNEVSVQLTPRKFARNMILSLSSGDIGAFEEKMLGAENVNFLIVALSSFGGYSSPEDIHNID